MLKPAQIQQVADYVWIKFYGHADPEDRRRARARRLFAENCAVCHGDTAGQPRGRRAAARQPRPSVWRQPRGDRRAGQHAAAGVMPNWSSRLDPATIKSVALYVHSLGGGE